MLLKLIRTHQELARLILALLLLIAIAQSWRLGSLQTPVLGSSTSSDATSRSFRPSSQKPVFSYDKNFPARIWQAYGLVGDGSGLERWTEQINTWKTNNRDWQYTLLTNDTATEFVEAHFRDRPAIVHFWHELGPTILRADFIRYLAMLAKGGIYSDVDTSNIKPVSEFIPPSLQSKEINAIVGIEYDDTTYPLFIRNVSFTQWTLMAKPNHPLFETAVKRFMSNMEFLARLKGQEIGSLVAEKKDVLQGTGPGMFTDAVFETLRDQTSENIDWTTFHDQKEPTVYGDILVLPINGFGSGQKHSHSSKPEYGEVLVRHHFGKSWYQHD